MLVKRIEPIAHSLLFFLLGSYCHSIRYDSFSKNKLKDLINFIEDEYKDLDPPKDICYVTLEDENKPEAIFVANGKGKKLKETVSNIKKSYLDVIDDFYSDSTNDEKDFLVEEVENKRNDYNG